MAEEKLWTKRDEPTFREVVEWAEKQPEAYKPTIGFMKQILAEYEEAMGKGRGR